MFTRCCVVVLLVAGTVGCDGVTKHLAQENLAGRPVQSFLADTIRLSYTENTGGFLSLGETLPESARTMLFTVATGALLLWLAVVAWRSAWRRWTLPLSLFVAGGLSNWIDRVVDGKVVDFLNVGLGGVRTGVFNVADIAITVGAVLLLFTESRASRSDRSPTTRS